MTANTYNPAPTVTDVLPVWVNHGVCYSRAVYTDEAVARAVGEHIRARGGTVNGGFMHGSPLGGVTATVFDGAPAWEVRF